MERKGGVLYIGIDLGTSRTSVAASNGVRETVWSFVGYPRDAVSRKLLGTDKVFGKEAVDRRLALELFRPLRHGVIQSDGAGNGAGKGAAQGEGDEDGPGLSQAEAERHMQAARDLVQHALSRARPRSDELIYGVIGAPARASHKNKEMIIQASREHLDAVMVCSEPFAVAYGLGLLDDTLVVDIGAGTVDLCRMHGTLPSEDDQITLKTAGDWVDEQLYALLKKKAPKADFSMHFVKELKERYATVEPRGPVEIELLVNGRPTAFEVSNEVRLACRKIIPPIVLAMHKLISTFDPDFQARLRDNVLLGGGGSQIVGLATALEQAMRQMLGSGRVRQADEPTYAGCNGALKMAHDMPEEYWKQLS
ncbi:MAG: rod shape-determining protein [Planctomycetota bacterium]